MILYIFLYGNHDLCSEDRITIIKYVHGGRFVYVFARLTKKTNTFLVPL